MDSTERLLPALKALADPTRLRILAILSSGAFHVNEIVTILDMGQSRVSRHLRILSDARLVSFRREGSCVFYRLSEAWTHSRAELRFLRVLGREIATSRGDQAAVEACLERRRAAAEQFFSEVAGDWDSRREHIEGPPTQVGPLIEEIGTTGTVVDLGTGTGILLKLLSAVADRVIGVDASAEMLEVARRKVLEDRLSNIELRLGRLEHLPVSDGEVDTMVANMVLHHVAAPSEALREVHRGLRPGGRLVIADYAAHSDESYRERLGDLWLGLARLDLEAWLEEAHFELQSYAELGGDETESLRETNAHRAVADPCEVSRPRVLLVVARRVARDTESERRTTTTAFQETGR